MSLGIELGKKLDMLAPNIRYSITVNPDNQYHDSPSGRLDKLYKRIKRMMDSLSFEYLMYLEISTPKWKSTNIPRLHGHGIIYFRNYSQVRRWYEQDYCRLQKFAYFDVDTISNESKWLDYCKKNSSIMRNIMVNKITSPMWIQEELVFQGEAHPSLGLSDEEN